MTDTAIRTPRQSALMNALTCQGRIISALMLRELQGRFGRLQFGALWLLIEPLAYAAFLTEVRGAILGRHADIGTSIELFFFTGFVPYLFFRNVESRVGSAINSNRPLLVLPLVTNLDVMLACAFLEIAILSIATVIWIFALWALGLQYIPHEPLRFLTALGATILLGFGFGTCTAIVTTLSPTAGKFIPWINRAMFMTSGAILSTARFPYEIQYILSWNPLYHCVEWVRSAFYAEYESTLLNPPYLLFCAILLMGGGLLLERLLRRQLSAR